MIIIYKNNNYYENISLMNKCIYNPIKKIDRFMFDKYKIFMNKYLI